MPKPSPIIRTLQRKMSKTSLIDLADETGLSERWLFMLRDNQIPKPGLPHIETLARRFGYRLRLTPMGKRPAKHDDANLNPHL